VKISNHYFNNIKYLIGRFKRSLLLARQIGDRAVSAAKC